MPGGKGELTFAEELQAEIGPVVDILADDLERFGVEVGQRRPDLHDVEDDFVDLEHAEHVRPPQLVGLAPAALQLQRVQHALRHVVLSDRLLPGAAVVVDRDELVPEEVQLAPHDRREVVVQPEHGARSHDGRIRERLPHHLLALVFGLEIEGGGVCFRSGR